MTTFRRSVTAYLADSSGNGYGSLTVLDAACTLDEGWAPYAQADLVIKLPDLTALGRISDLSTRSRVVFTVGTLPPSGTGGATYRTFDLGIIARQVNHRAGTVSLALASDESLLQDYAHTGLTPDMGLRPLQRSVRNMVNYVLTKALGRTSFVEETNDFDFTTYSSARNIWAYKLGKSGYTIPSIGSTTFVGSDAITVSPNTSQPISYVYADVNLVAGQTYTWSADVRQPAVQAGTLNVNARRLVVFTEAAGVSRVHAVSPQKANAVSNQRVRFTFTMPANLTGSELRLYSGGSTAGGGNITFANILIVEGDGLDEFGQPIEFFDGDTPASVGYTYSWDGEVNSSTSTRTPRLNRSPESLIWSPGQTAWDLLKPILEASGLRLWCDELGKWHLTTSTYSRTGTVTAHAGVELYDAIDLVSRTASQSSGVPLYVDAVIVRYTWIDEKGNDRERYDVATTTGFIKPFLVERPETPFPGAGAATYLLRRYMQRRRQVPVTRSLLQTTNPGQTVTIKVGDGSTLTGYLDAVTFDFGVDEMSLKTKDLT